MGVRVYELARTLGRSSKDLMHELKKQGIELKSHMSSIDAETADLVAEILKAATPPSVKEALVVPPVGEEAGGATADAVGAPPTAVAPERMVAAPATPEPVV